MLSVREISKLPKMGISHTTYLAKKLLLKLLSGIKHGQLTIIEAQETYHFGSDQAPSSPKAIIQIHDPRVYRRVLTGGTIASGEAYIDGDWSSDDLSEVTRLFSANMQTMESMRARQPWLMRRALKLTHFANRNTQSGARRNISAHYDLGNDFFALFLDPTLMYSAAVFPEDSDDLDIAAIHKLKIICESLELKTTDHLIEIGTGWGGMAIYAAENYGCRVTTTTISREQYEHTKKIVTDRGLTAQITVLCKDYRDLQGQFDKLVSVEMIEAVGHEFYDSYFDCVNKLLTPSGKAVIQAITISKQRYEQARDSVDYIKRYIFPGGCLPSLAIISNCLARHTDMQMIDLRDITLDYAKTLAHWHQRFLCEIDEVRNQGFDERFIRMWRFYLSYCEGGFRERIIGTYQITMAKPHYRP